MHNFNFNDDFEISLTLGLNEPHEATNLQALAAKKLGISLSDMPELEIKKHSIDARHGYVRLVYTLGVVDSQRNERIHKVLVKEVKGEPVIIIGGGPAGLFCAYELARAGIASVICERGKMVQERRKDLKCLNQDGLVDDDSNYCFGEGGAGTYSDGKLYTRSHKRGSVREILEILVAHGAKNDILTNARPHIGSNKLPKVITALRESLEKVGVRFLFGARVVNILVDKNCARGVKLADGREILGRAVVIASGHSARDIYYMLEKLGVKLEAKSFAMGLRIEHPQALINAIQYGRFAQHKSLPPAYYRLAYTPSDGRGAFSFCMCPGGWIVPASTTKNELVVNGMSLSKRDSAYANSGFVVAVSVEDLASLKLSGPLGGIELQSRLEKYAMDAGGGLLVAPATRLSDFMAQRSSHTVPKTSYLPGLKATDLHEVLAATKLPLASRLQEAVKHFNHIMPGYISEEAVLVGVESRTSSPVRIMRDQENLCSNIKGLYPCGEGAGYAGGIVSAAMDGIKVANTIKAHHT